MPSPSTPLPPPKKNYFTHSSLAPPLENWESMGIREPHEVKKKSFDLGGNQTHDLRIRSTVTLPTELRGRTEKVGDDLGRESVQLALKFTLQSSFMLILLLHHFCSQCYAAQHSLKIIHRSGGE